MSLAGIVLIVFHGSGQGIFVSRPVSSGYAAHDIPLAQELQRRANNIMEALVSCSLFPSIKHMLKVQGLDVGACRAPFPTLTDEQKAYIEKVVAENM